ncbi:D-alanyl-D-alanine carboxypeptidase [Streptomyces niveus]|uniref:D-alanyl-D-alanine carboxypeptidase n=1 Tax=Streptomyces niveus TaxID=193462 RepID=UPI0036D24937
MPAGSAGDSEAAPAASGAKPDTAPVADVVPAEPETDSGRKPGVAASAKTGGGSGVNFRRPAGTAPVGQTDTESSASRSDAAPARPAGGQASPAESEDTSGQKPDTAAAAAGVTSAKSQTAPEATPGEPGVDRQTAVFKALKRPGVDQPTAMLKLPPQPPAPASELPAERTSKFVPLRSEQAQPAGVAEAERTRQQPMPPLPPLDLLAELTNKPAPPETPTRTVVRRVKIWTPLLVLVLIIFAVVQAVRPLPAPSLNLTAKSTYTFEGDKPSLPWPGEGQGFMAATGLGTVDSFGEQKAVPIGSVAKAMTAYVVLKDKPLAKGADGPSITVDAKAEEDGGLDAQGESTLNTVKEGDKLTQHDALAALMIPSANNIARLLARWNADGSEEAFVKKMNDTAEELGMKNTTYTDPSGLDATTVSSAEDQVKLGQKLVEFEALMDITKLPEWEDPSGKIWRNYNTLVPYDGALGIKTGSTTKAGGNLLFAAHKTVGDTDQLIVGAVLGQHKAPIIDTVNAVSKDVMLATQDELESATIVKKGQVVGEFDNGMGTTAPVVATEDVKAVGWSGLTVKLELSDEGKDLPQSAAAGTHVGLLTVGEGKSRVEVAVALQGDLAEPTFGDKLTRVG